MTSKTASLSVLIVSHRAGALLHRTLTSVSQSDLSSVTQIVLVVNGKGNVDRLSERYPNLPLVVLKISDRRKTVALNVGVRHIGRGPVVFLDDDVRVSKELFKVYSCNFSRAEVRTYFGGGTKCDYVVLPRHWLVPFLPDSAKGLVGTQTDFALGRRSFLGFNWAARAEDIIEQGGYDETIGPGTGILGGDETKMQGVLRNAGFSAVFLENAVVWHFVPPSRCSLRWAIDRHRSVGLFCSSEMLRMREIEFSSALRKLKYSALFPFHLELQGARKTVGMNILALAFSLARCLGIIEGIVFRRTIY